MNETITFGQKVGFALVLTFLLAMCVANFTQRKSNQQKEETSIETGLVKARVLMANR